MIKTVINDIQQNGQIRDAIKKCAEGTILKEVNKPKEVRE